MLDGLRVVELGDSLAVQMCGMLLASLGADVLKIEPASGERDGLWKRGSAAFANLNRGKRSLLLDVGTEGGKAELMLRLEGADVFLHRLTPATARALGLDDAALMRLFPKLVICGITGSPQWHPDAERSDDEVLVAARLGELYENDGHRAGPIVHRYPRGQFGAAQLAGGGILARLVIRLQTGRGGQANTSILQGMIAGLSNVWVRNSQGPMPNPPTHDPDTPRAPSYQLHWCRDGWLQIMDPAQQFDYGLLPGMWPALAAGIDIGVPEGLEQAFARETVGTWLEQLREHDIACEPAAPLGYVLGLDATRENGYVADLVDPDLGRVTGPASPFHADVALPPCRAVPRPGEGGEKAWDDHRAHPVPPAGGNADPAHPLSGVKVVDFGMFLAGPLGPSLMGDLGANVIKVESLSGDRMRFMHHFFQAAQRSKRSLAVDLAHPDARVILERLAGWADVIHHNMRFRNAAKLGLGEEGLRAIAPDVGFSYVSAYGQQCHRKDWPGYDTIFTALAGWEFENAGMGNRPITMRPGPIDFLTAHTCFFATMAVLYARRAGVPGRVLHSSMLGVITMTQCELVVREDGSLSETYRLAADQTGFSPWHRIYRAGDGEWIAVAAHCDGERAAMRRVLGCDDGGFEQAIAARDAADVLSGLEVAGVPCDAVFYSDGMNRRFDDPVSRAAGLVVGVDHPTFGRVEQPGIFWDMGAVAIKIDRPSPELGQHTDEILKELGFSGEEVARFRERKVVA